MRRTDASTGELVEDVKPATTPLSKADKDLRIKVKVYSPFKVYFDEEAISISAENATGPFDVLPKHHNFMTLLNPCELVIRQVGGEQRIRIARGIMHVAHDQVTVFLDV